MPRPGQTDAQRKLVLPAIDEPRRLVPFPPNRNKLPAPKKKRYIIDDDEQDEGDRRRGKDNARDAGKRERQQQQRYEKEQIRASERQSMEDKL